MFEKVLIANRGEIALRINRACHEMGIKTVAVHSTADADAMHVRLADEAVCIGSPLAQDSYLNKAAIISAALITGADAIHPGYGFLSENADFAEMVEEHGLTFIGPTPKMIRLMGDKITAKKSAIEAGLPVVPGSKGSVDTIEQALQTAHEIGYPIIIKASAGGGGKGMKIAFNDDELKEMYPIARREAKSNFANDIVYMEKYLQNPRHIEIQVLADTHGNVVHLGERDCSLQRHNQKVLEESPSPALNKEQRQKIGSVVCNAMKNLGYSSVGTIEFLYENGEFYFMEMNTRIQVEHPVTEMVTGIDIIQEQIRIANGAVLNLTQEDIHFDGFAIECRINAENPETFIPSAGKVTTWHAPGGLWVRVDSEVYAGYVIPPYYDSMIAKLIVFGRTRNSCLMRLKRALEEFVIEGVQTTIPLHQKIIVQPDFIDGQYNIHWLENFLKKQEEEKKEKNV
jgi:acetyl-CoA carboxylase, biotin carboxylase subunit